MNILKNKCINDVVIIDGLTRSGKFYLGKLISGINGLEYFINSSEVERIIAINKSGTLSDSDASALIVVAMNESIYNMAIGRNLNMRHDDGSSILNSFEKELYIDRQDKGASGHCSIDKVIDCKRSSVFILHQSLESLDVVKSAAPKSKIINIRRNPVDLVYSWIKRGWGTRFVNDLLSFGPTYIYKHGVVPYFAVDWADDYLSSNEYECVIKSIIHLTESESSMVNEKRSDVCSIYYEKLVKNTHKEMGKICEFLGRKPNKIMSKIIEKETFDVDFESERVRKIDYIKSGVKNKILFDKLLDIEELYCKNIGDTL